MAEIGCEVVANPGTDLSFHWMFNTSQEMIDIQQAQIRHNGSHSWVDYVPRTPHDYGSLLCWGENSVGVQIQPCVIQLLPATPPSPVHSCELVHTLLACIPGDDGGARQIFLMENRETVTGE